MIKRPNLLQRLLHRFVMIKPVTAFFAPRTHRLDNFILKLTGGKYTASEFFGWSIVELTTLGAKTGLPRTMPLIALFDEDKIALIASSFGREHNPGWYYNLMKHAKCSIKFRNQTTEYIARETEGAEREKYWQLGLFYYQGYGLYKKRASHRVIPVMVLEPVK